MSARLVVLGVDAANPYLIRRWAAEGRLPAIRGVLERGRSGLVDGLKGFFIGSTWPSFYTGLNPAGHGFHRIVQLRSGTYDFFRPLGSPDGLGGTPFWRLASEAGRRVAVLDVPLSCPEAGLNGVQIVEWGGHDSVFGFQAAPPRVAEVVRSGVGDYPMPANCDAPRPSPADFEEFVTGLESAVAKKTALTLDLLAADEWDLFIQVFTESHCVGHQAWHIHDPAHPAHDPQLLETLGDPVERTYRAIDRAIGTILEAVADARVLLLSAHGMSYYRGAGFLLPEILYRLGVTGRPAPTELRGLRGLARAGTRLVWRRLVPDRVKALIRPPAPTYSPRSRPLPTLRVDVSRSKCFPVANGQPVGGIRLNLSGREPGGILEPGPEEEAFCQQLREDLLAIVDDRTGGPLVADVYRTNSIYAGHRLHALPDLLVEWSDALPTGSRAHAGGRGSTIRATSPKIGTIEASNAYGRTGDHIPTGFFVYTAPGLQPGAKSRPVSVMDFHPTICQLLGLADPDVDGVAIPDLEGLRWS